MKPAYVIQKTEHSKCPKCHQPVYLLSHANCEQGMPAFYICFGCKFVGEVGKGKVQSDDGKEE